MELVGLEDVVFPLNVRPVESSLMVSWGYSFNNAVVLSNFTLLVEQYTAGVLMDRSFPVES